MFELQEIISSYTRANAINDGVLVDVSETAREAGIKFPVAVTIAVWQEYIEPLENDRLKWGQDIQGRLWDSVWMLRLACQKTSGDVLFFTVRYRMRGKLRVIRLKALCHPGDNWEPVITVMKPDES
uniref:Uncharacterized protein n=1 Tax=viral metagenome TaxID=1070528 RepID=A0A6H1ZH32_9ZZZZ